MIDVVIEVKKLDNGELSLASLEWPEHALITHAVVVANHPTIRLREGYIDIRLANGRAVYKIDDEKLGVYETTCVYAELM